MQKIVIIDDNSIIRLVLSSMFLHTFKDFEFETFTADNGVAGLGYVFITRPDLIIVDITLPKYSGKEVIDFLSSNGSIVDKSIPIIVLTENESCPILPGNFKCVNKSSDKFVESLQKDISEILKIGVEDSLRSKLFRILTNRIINLGNKVDIINNEFFKNIQKKFLSIPYLILSNLKFSLLISLFFIFFERREKESNIEQRKRDSSSLRVKAFPAIALFFAFVFFSTFQIGSVFGGFGIFTFLRGNENVAAASYTWDGGGSDGTCGGAVGDGNKWSCALNWSSDIVPTSVDTVTFDGTSTKDAVVDSGFGGVVTSVSINAGYTGTITQQRSLQTTSTFTQADGTFDSSNQTFDVNSAFNLNSGIFRASSGSVHFGSHFTISGGVFDVTTNPGGAVIFDDIDNGTLSCNNTSFNLVIFNNTSSKTVGSNCNMPLGNNPTISGTGIINVNGTLSGSGTLTRTVGNLIMNPGGTLSGFSGLNLVTFTVAGATLDLSGYSTFSTSSTFTLSSGSIALPSGADINAALAISGGTFTAPSGIMTLAGALTISGAPIFNANGGTVVFDGSLGDALSCNNVTFNLVVFANTGGEKVVNSNCTMPLGNNPTMTRGIFLNGTLTGTGTMTLGSTFIMTAGSVISGFSGLSVAGYTVSGASVDLSSYTTFVASGNVLLSSGSLTLPNGADLNSGSSTIALQITGGTFNAPSGTMSLAGGLTISGAPTFNANGGTITLDGGSANLSCNNVTFNSVNFTGAIGTKTVQSNCTLPLGANPAIPMNLHNSGIISGTGTVAMGAGTTLTHNGTTANLSGFSGLTSGSVVVQNNAVFDIGSYTTFTNTSSFTQSSGTVTLPSGTDLNGLLIISGGTFNAPSGTMNLASTLTVSGSPTFNANGGNFIVDGGNATLTCNNITFNLFTFAHTANLKTVGATCNLPLGNNPTLGAGGTAQVTLHGTLTGSGTISAFGQLTLSGGATLSGFTGFSSNGATGLSLFNSGATSNFGSYSSFVVAGSVVLSSGTLTLPDGAEIDSFNGLSITGGTFNAPSGIMNLAGQLSISGSPIFNANGGTINADGTSDATWTCNNVVFNLVTFNHNGSGIRTIGANCNIPLGNNPTVTGRIRINSSTANVTGSGLFTSTCQASSCFWLTNGNFGGFSGFIAYGNVAVTGSHLNLGSYSPVIIYGRNTTQALGITTGGIFTAPSGTMTIYDSLNVTSATFNHNNGTVEFNAEAEDLAIGLSGSDSITFNNMIANVSISANFNFRPASTTTVLGNLEIKGLNSSTLLNLVSSTAGSQWNLDVSNATGIDLEYLNVSDSNSVNSIINVAGLNVTNGGNNTNWNFGNPIVSNLGPTDVIDDSATNNQKPSFTFDVTDPDSSDQVTYQIQIDNDDNFSSPVIDTTSTPASQGSFTFTPTSNIPEGEYYWRVRGFDASGGISDYVAANNGSTAFTIDITPPTGGVLIKSISEENPLDISLLLLAFDNLSGVSQMIISENLNFAGATYETYQTSINYTLSSSNIKIIYARYKDNAGNESAIYLANIISLTPTVTPTPTVIVTITPTAGLTPTPTVDVPISDEISDPPIVDQTVVATIVLITSIYFVSSVTSILVISPNMALNINNLLALIGIFFGSIIPRNRKYWGIVFDARESKGMAFTVIRLVNLDTKELSETVSDINGRYGFAASPGTYRIAVKVEGYDKFEKEVNVSKDKDIIEDIKLNRLGAKKSLKINLNLQAERILNIIKIIILILMVSGFFYTLFIYLNNPQLTNLIILALYLFLFIANLYQFIKTNSGSIGKIIDKESKIGLNLASIRLFGKDRTYIALSNKQGLFRLNVSKGEYRKYIYREGYRHDAEDTVKSSDAGFINTNFELKKLDNEESSQRFGSI